MMAISTSLHLNFIDLPHFSRIHFAVFFILQICHLQDVTFDSSHLYLCGCVCPTLLLLARYVRCDHCLSVSLSVSLPSLVPFPFLDGTHIVGGGGRVLAHDAVTAHMLAFDMCVYYMSTH